MARVFFTEDLLIVDIGQYCYIWPWALRIFPFLTLRVSGDSGKRIILICAAQQDE